MSGWIWAGLAVVAFFVLRGPIRQFQLGLHLTRMTNIFEAIECARLGAAMGIAGIPTFSDEEQQRAIAVFDRGLAYLQQFPRHVVTRELLKNALLAQHMDRPVRAAAIGRLIDALAGEGAGLELEDFLKSYA